MDQLLKTEKISELLLGVITEFYEKDQRAQTFGTDTKLYHSEIHMLQCIKENEGLHISAIARILGITRGAASQTVTRLENKKFILKNVDLNNNSRIILKLTPKGETAYRCHKKYHERYSREVSRILKDVNNGQLEFLCDFLREFEKVI